MRTTLTLDPDVAAMLKKRVARGGVTMKEAVNDAMRRGLSAESNKPRKRYVLNPGPPSGGFLIDVNDKEALWEMLDREDYGDLFRREPPASSD